MEYDWLVRNILYEKKILIITNYKFYFRTGSTSMANHLFPNFVLFLSSKLLLAAKTCLVLKHASFYKSCDSYFSSYSCFSTSLMDLWGRPWNLNNYQNTGAWRPNAPIILQNSMLPMKNLLKFQAMFIIFLDSSCQTTENELRFHRKRNSRKNTCQKELTNFLIWRLPCE